jgi:hypothetical protein
MLVLSLFIGLVGCEKDYSNQPEYQVEIGEMVTLYFSTNSCCQVCLSQKNDHQHISYVEEISVDPGPEDCAGCDYTMAFVFEAIAEGSDTVFLNHSLASESCYDQLIEDSKFIINVGKEISP